MLAEVFEDNSGGALPLPTNQRITSRKNYFLVIWNFFWSHINNGDTKVSKLDTKLQARWRLVDKGNAS